MSNTLPSEGHGQNAKSLLPMRKLSLIDMAIGHCDLALKTLVAGRTTSMRRNPADEQSPPSLDAQQQKHSAGLMRVNHAGEVCAQALYQGQSLTAKLPSVRRDMTNAATEEEDHLAWCQQRLNELNSRASVFNPIWYGLSFGIGASAGLVSDKLSLGFVAATEQQVCKHLDKHLTALPEQDGKSRAIVSQMRQDEAEHAQTALAAGGVQFPKPVTFVMSQVAKVMTSLSYRL
ncbi:MAG TPA: 2-polyprenyl-3-methyl-6-methoxy-1,4-benzoquinone monooxygenase [Marinagarivorans sp.]